MRPSAGTCHHLTIGWADHVHENGAHLEYDIGDNNYAIPKSSVERIEAGGIAPPYASSDANAKDLEDLPTLAPVHNFGNQLELIAKIIRDGRVDPDALAVLDQQSDSDTSAAGYFIAGKHEFETENFSKARTYLQEALRFNSQNPAILNYYAATLVRSNLPRIIAATPSAAGSALFRFVPIP